MVYILFISLLSCAYGTEWNFDSTENIVSVNIIDDVLYIGCNDKLYSFSKELVKISFNTSNNNFITTVIKPDDLLACGTNSEKPTCWNVGNFITIDSKRYRGYAPYTNNNHITIINHNDCVFSDINIVRNGDKRWRRHNSSTCGYSLYTSDNAIPKKGLDGAFISQDGNNYKVYTIFTSTIVKKRKEYIPYIAQMCMMDSGGPSSMSVNRWSTFLKAELECHIDGRSYRKIIKHKLVKNGDDEILYILFGSPWGMSAICGYSMNDIKRLFSVSKLEGYKGKLPSQPGICLPQGKTISQSMFDIIETYNTIVDIIHPLSMKPIFEIRRNINTFDIYNDIIYFVTVNNTLYSFNMTTAIVNKLKKITSKVIFVNMLGNRLVIVTNTGIYVNY
ncbi:hypothetical protein Murmansk-156 [Murmansk poxvirus]|uniref:Sema domain-containing protein n=1 Tax=Murmansk poxvirus TaxID=2025359 RepID=A0A223FMY2_9POXV|nr:hypothetical protein CKM52_gp156 [Murmansk poxvirus]AST09351.1 hypothetical protein Murmansk-156 [Murmansk poxvirus]